MRAQLTFKLPEEQIEHMHAMQGTAYSIIINDLDQWLRQEQKYQQRESIPVEEVRDRLRELWDDNFINFESIAQ